MRKTKRLLAFVLSFVLMLSGIQPFELKAYAAAPEGYVTFTFPDGKLLDGNNEPITNDVTNFSNRFTASYNNYPFVIGDWEHQASLEYNRNIPFFISEKGKYEPANIRVAVRPAGEEPERDTSENDGGDTSQNDGGDTSQNDGGDTSQNDGGDTSQNDGGDTSQNEGGGDASQNDGAGNVSQNDGSANNTGVNGGAGDVSQNVGTGDNTGVNGGAGDANQNSGGEEGNSGDTGSDGPVGTAGTISPEWELYFDITDDDIYFELLDYGQFALRVKADKLGEYALNIDYCSDDLVKPILAYLCVNNNSNKRYFKYHKAFDAYVNKNGQDRPVDGILLSELQADNNTENRVTIATDFDKFSVLQFNVNNNTGNKVTWDSDGNLVFHVDGYDYKFAIGIIDPLTKLFDEATVNWNSASQGFNAFYTTNYAGGQIVADDAKKDPQLIVLFNKKYGLKYLGGGPVEDLSFFRINVGRKNTEISFETFEPEGADAYKAFVINPSVLSDGNQDDNEPSGFNRYNLHLNVDVKMLNNVTIKTDTANTVVSGVTINNVVVGNATSSGKDKFSKAVGNTRGWYEDVTSNDVSDNEGGHIEHICFAEFDDLWVEGVTSGYIITSVYVDNTGSDNDFELEVDRNGINSKPKLYHVEKNPETEEEIGRTEFDNPNDFKSSKGDVCGGAYGVIKDGAIITFKMKKVWAELNSQDNGGISPDDQLHEYAYNLQDAIDKTKAFYEKTESSNDLTNLEHINWDIKEKDITLSDDTLKFYTGAGKTQADDEAIERFIRINLYSSDDSYGKLTVPKNKTLSFPGGIQGDVKVKEDGTGEGAQILLESGATLHVYSVFDEAYLVGDRLEQRGNVHVYGITGTSANIIVGRDDETHDGDGSSVDVAMTLGIAKVTVNPRSNFNGLYEDHDDKRWDEEQQQEVVTHVHKDPKSNISIGTIELKGAVKEHHDDEFGGWDDGCGGHFKVDENDTVSIENVIVGRFSNFELNGQLGKKINSLTVSGRADLNSVTATAGNSAQIGTVTVNEFGEIRFKKVKANVTSINVGQGARANLSGASEYNLDIDKIDLAEGSNATLYGSVLARNLTVNAYSSVQTYNFNIIGATGKDVFEIKRHARLVNYGFLRVYAPTKLSGESEIRTRDILQLEGAITLVGFTREDGAKDSDFNLIKTPEGFITIGNTVTGGFNPSKMEGVRIALYNAEDIDYVWQNDRKSIPEDYAEYYSDPENYDGGWYEEGGDSTLRPFKLGRSIINVHASLNEKYDLFALRTSEYGGEQEWCFVRNAGSSIECYDIYPKSVTFYVADAVEGVYPEWGDDSITAFEVDGTQKEFVDTYEIFDYINNQDNYGEFSGKKLYIKVPGHVYLDNFRLPGNDVEFVTDDPFCGDTLEVEIGNGSYNSLKFDLDGVGLVFVNRENTPADAITNKLTLGDVYLKNGAWINASNDELYNCEGGTRTITINKIEVSGRLEGDEVPTSGIKVTGDNDLHVTNEIKVADGSEFWIDSWKTVSADNVTVGNDAGLDARCGYFTVSDTFSLGTDAHANVNATNDINIATTTVGGSSVNENGEVLEGKGNRLDIHADDEFIGTTFTISDNAQDVRLSAEMVDIAGTLEAGNNVRNCSFDAYRNFLSSDCTISIGENSYVFFGSADLNVKKVVVGENSQFGAYIDSHDECSIGNLRIGEGGLWIYDCANIDADKLHVVGQTVMVGRAHMNLLGNNTKEFYGGICLAWDEDCKNEDGSDVDFQCPCIQKIVPGSEVLFGADVQIGAIENDEFVEKAKEMCLTIENRKMGAERNEFFGSKDSIVKVRVPDENRMPDADKIHVNPGENGDQYAEYSDVEAIGPGNKLYRVLRIQGIQVKVSAKDETFNEATLVTTPADYSEAIAYINKIGNTSQKYYVVLPGNEYRINGGLELPKAASAATFEIVGKAWEEDGDHGKYTNTTMLRFTGDVKLLTDTTFTDVKLVSVPKPGSTADQKKAYTAKFDASGKNVLFDRASVNIDKEIENVDWTGFTTVTGNGNITVKNLRESGRFEVANDLAVKNLTLEEATAYVGGKLAVAGDFKAFNDARIEGMTGGTTFAGNVYMHRAGIAPKTGAVTFNKNIYFNHSYIELNLDWDSADPTLREDSMWRVVNYDGGTVSVTVRGNAYLSNTMVAINGSVTLNNLFMDRWVDVIYGLGEKDTFSVKKATAVFNGELPDGDDFPDDPFSSMADSNWSTELGWDPGITYKVASNNKNEYKSAAEGTVSVRRANIEMTAYKGDTPEDLSVNYVNLSRDIALVDDVTFANELIQLYAAKEDTAIVNTTEDSIKFILGAYHVSDQPPYAFYVLKNAGNKLVIDTDSNAYSVLLNVVPNLSKEDYTPLRIGYYKTLEEAFNKIKAINNKNNSYSISVTKSGDLGTTIDKDFAIPAQAYKIMIDNQAGENEVVTLKFKNKITATTNVYMNGIKLVSKEATTFALGNFDLEFDDCDLRDISEIKSITGSNVNGGSSMKFRFGQAAVEEYESHSNAYLPDGRFAITVGSVDKVGELCIQNVALTITGKANVGALDGSAYGYYDGEHSLLKYYDATGTFLGNDPEAIRWDESRKEDVYVVNENDLSDPANKVVDYTKSVQEWGTQTAISGYTKLIVTVNTTGSKIAETTVNDVKVDASTLKVVPNLTVNGEITCEGGMRRELEGAGAEQDWRETPVSQVFTITPCVLNGKDLKPVEEYFTNLYGSQEPVENLNALRSEGIPFAIAPKANADSAKYDKWLTTLRCRPETENGMYIKQVAGSSVYICYSNKSYAPYTVAKLEDGKEVKIADVMSWQNAVNTINKAATKQDYVIILNHSSEADVAGAESEALAPNKINEPDTLTMPAANAVNSLKIRSAEWTNHEVVPAWFYLGDKITLTSTTTFENINFIGVGQDKKTKEYFVLDETNGNALTISAPVALTINGKVFMNDRAVIIDGGKKGMLYFGSDAVLARDPETASNNNIDGIGAIKNMNTMFLNGLKVELKPYYATVANFNKNPKVETAPELSATTYMLYGNPSINADGGTITGTYLLAGGASIDTGAKGKITLTNIIVDGGGDTNFNAATVTISGTTTVRTDGFSISGYASGALKFNGTFDIKEGCTIKLDPYANGTSIVAVNAEADKPVGGFVFAVAPKAASAAIFKAATVAANGTATVSEYDGTNEKTAFFLIKDAKGNVLGYNGYSVKATVSALPMGTDPSSETPVLEGFYVTYADAINSMNDKSKDFYVKVYDETSSLDVPIQITAPAAAKAASLTIGSEGNAKIYYDKAPALANNVTFNSVTLCPVKAAGKGAEHKYTTEGAALGITLNGTNTLTFSDVTTTGTTLTDIKAAAGTIVFDGCNTFKAKGTVSAKTINVNDSNISCATTATDILDVNDSAFAGNKLTVNKTLKSVDSSLDFEKEVVLNDVEAAGNNDLTLYYVAINGTMLTIKGYVTGKINLVMYADADGTEKITERYALTKADAEKIGNAKNKILLTAKNLETSQIESFKAQIYMSDEVWEIPSDLSYVKANGGFYFTEDDGDLASYAVGLKIGDSGVENTYLDFNQAVSRINELKNSAEEYTIEIYDDLEDTCATDTVKYSKLVLPGDNMCSKLTVNANNNDIKFSGSDAVTAFGTVEFADAMLKPVDSKTGAASAASFNLKVNGKANPKVSELIIDDADTLVVKSITGVKGVSKLTLAGTTLIAGTSLDSLGTIVLDDHDAPSCIAALKVANIGTIESDDADNEVIVTTTASVDNIKGDLALFTGYSYKTDKNGTKSNFASKFTLNGIVENGTVNVWPFDTAATITSDYAAIKTSIGTIDETKIDGNIPLLVAKKANASAFKVNGRDYTSIDPVYVMFKDAKWQVMCDDKNNLAVEITGAGGFDTYAQSWSTAVAIVDSIADKDAEYTFKLLKEETYADSKNGGTANTKTAGALVTPKLANVKMITVTSEADVSGKLIYSGALNPTCSIIFDNVKVEERTKNEANGLHVSKINASAAVTVGFTYKAYNSVDKDSNKLLTFNTISVPKGILYLGSGVEIGANGAITTGGIDYDGNVSIKPIADSKKAYAKQTYGTITSNVTATAPGTLTLSNYFSKAIPTSAASQLSITGKVDPLANIEVFMYNAKYTHDGKKYVLATGEDKDKYEEMSVYDFMYEFLLYRDASKAPVARTALINAPFVSMDQIGFNGIYIDEDGNEQPYGVDERLFTKMAGNFYFTNRELPLIVELDIDTNDNHLFVDPEDRHESFVSWDAAVTELNKITNADYNYQLTLCNDVGEAVMTNRKITANKRDEYFDIITAVPLAKLNMPVNVSDLTIVGDGNRFIFTSPAIAINSNVKFENVSFVCLKKVTNKIVREEDNKKYNYNVPTYASTPIAISVAANRSVTINGYHSEDWLQYTEYIGENERNDCEVKVGETAISAITGTATSKFAVESCELPVIGKMATFDQVNCNNSRLTISGDLNVSKLIVNEADVAAGNVTVTTALTLTSTEGASVMAGGAGNMKLNNVLTIGDNCRVTAKANAKGASLLNISGTIVNFGEKLKIGVMYASATVDNPLYVAFIDGQTVATLANAEALANITLLVSAGDAEDGHVVGEPAQFDPEGVCTNSGWYLGYTAKGKTVTFNRAVSATAP
ncbi:MAG: hypothetical protein K5679_11485 [Lachnospiraceae bacterium]|nr:hypothetical protein [Lachnospiraceae bacterium]